MNVLALLLVVSFAPIAGAQSASVDDAGAATGAELGAELVTQPTLPILVTAAAAPYPQLALELGLEASVLLELDVSDQGMVLDARLVAPAQPLDPALDPASVAQLGFEEAALQAARNHRFTPARDALGLPVSARIQYRSRFTLAAAPFVSLVAVVQDDLGGPLPGTTITIAGPDGLRQEAVADDQGQVRFADLVPGTWVVAASSTGWVTDSAPLSLTERQTSELSFTLLPQVPQGNPAGQAGEVYEVFGERLQPEVTERVLTMEQVAYLPGTGGDVVKAVQNLPGVNRAPLGVGQILIRGTAPEDSTATLDGLPLPVVFHFAGLNTVINGDSLSEVAFLPGNYSVRYGRQLAGLVDLRTDSSLPEESQGYLSVDLFQTTAFVEQRLSDSTAISVSGRRSYIDTILSPVLTKVTGSTFQAPRYYDINARLLHRSARGDVFDAFLVGSSDVFRILGIDESTGTEETSFGLQTRFAKLRLLYRHVDDRGTRHESVLIAGPEEQAFQIAPDGQAFERPLELSFRHELLSVPPGGHFDDSYGLGWRVGLDVSASRYRFLYDVPSFGVREEGDIGVLAPAAYVEPTLRLGRWDLVAGLRTDLYTTDSGYSNTAVDPRLAVLFYPRQGTRLKLAAGRFSQFADPRQVTPSSDGVLDLRHEYAIQTGIGWEQDLGPSWSFELNGYDNWLRRLVVGNEGAFSFFTGPPLTGPLDTDPYANDGTGHSAGVEVLVKVQTPSTIGMLAGTVSRSVRQKRPDSDLVLFDYDQPVVLNALVSQDLPKSWKVGARFRFGSGNPYTPVVNRWLDQDGGDWQPVYGTDQARTPAFWQLDLRADKTWTFAGWELSAYLDLQNATNHSNAEVMSYSADYYTEQPVNGLPIIPAFGLKGKW